MFLLPILLLFVVMQYTMYMKRDVVPTNSQYGDRGTENGSKGSN